MITKSVTECRANFSEVLDEVEHKKRRVMIERNGKTAAVFIPLEDYELLRRLEDEMAERDRPSVAAEEGRRYRVGEIARPELAVR